MSPKILLAYADKQVSLIRFLTHCIKSCWFAPTAELPQVEWGRSPSWVVSSDSNSEHGTTRTPCMPSRALRRFNVLWGLISSSVIRQAIFCQQTLAGNCWKKCPNCEPICLLKVYHYKTTTIILQIKSRAHDNVEQPLKLEIKGIYIYKKPRNLHPIDNDFLYIWF